MCKFKFQILRCAVRRCRVHTWESAFSLKQSKLREKENKALPTHDKVEGGTAHSRSAYYSAALKLMRILMNVSASTLMRKGGRYHVLMTWKTWSLYYSSHCIFSKSFSSSASICAASQISTFLLTHQSRPYNVKRRPPQTSLLVDCLLARREIQPESLGEEGLEDWRLDPLSKNHIHTPCFQHKSLVKCAKARITKICLFGF